MPDNLTDHDARMQQAKEDELRPGTARDMERAAHGYTYRKAIKDVLAIIEEDKQECIGDGYPVLDYKKVKARIEAME